MTSHRAGANLIFLIWSFFVALSNGESESCVMEANWKTTYFGNIPRDFSDDRHLITVESKNVSFVGIRYSDDSWTGAILTTLAANNTGQWITFSLCTNRTKYMDNHDTFHFTVNVICKDGSNYWDSVQRTVEFMEANNWAPEFSQSSYNIFAEYPWPLLIPITQLPSNNVILVRDLDHADKINIFVSQSQSTNSVEVTKVSYAAPSLVLHGNYYKVDIFVTNNFVAGNTSFTLIAGDGIHNTSVLINMSVENKKCLDFKKPSYTGPEYQILQMQS